MSDDLQPASPLLLPQSPLYLAALKRQEAKRAAAQKNEEKPSLFFDPSRIHRLLNRFNARLWTLDNLQHFPLSKLDPEERKFVWFLQRNPHLFIRLAGLDRHPETLSPEDIKIAARLTGDALVLSSKDLAYLETLPATRPDQASHAALSPPSADGMIALLQKLSPQETLRFEDLDRMRPRFPFSPPLSPEERDLWRLLQSRSVRRILYNLSQTTQGQLTPEVIRILVSLLWNPSVMGAAPIVFFKSPAPEEHALAPVAAATGLDAESDMDSHRRASSMLVRAKATLHADALKQLLHRVSPFTDHATLAQLRQYRPQTPDEAHILNLIGQSGIYHLLSAQDGDASDLGMADIELALLEKTLVLSDPYLTLVMLP